MFIERLLNQGGSPLLQEVLKFTSARHDLIVENLANLDTPGYIQKDLSAARFQKALMERVMERAKHGDGVDMSVGPMEVENPNVGILALDGNNRSVDQMAVDLAKNALMHNVAVELLRKQYQQMDMALKERVV